MWNMSGKHCNYRFIIGLFQWYFTCTYSPLNFYVWSLWLLPFLQSPRWCGSDRRVPHTGQRWTSAPGCSHSPAPGSFHWCHCWAGTQRHCVRSGRGTRRTYPGCWQERCSYWAPSPSPGLCSSPHTIPRPCCSPGLSSAHLSEKRERETLWPDWNVYTRYTWVNHQPTPTWQLSWLNTTVILPRVRTRQKILQCKKNYLWFLWKIQTIKCFL